ncbi:MAG: BREX-2 system phosphatase PglZ [Microlunatus sp.]
MTVATRSPGITVVSPAMVHAMIDYVISQRYTSGDGVLGIRGRLGEDRLITEHQGRPVTVSFAESALAAREALLDWEPGRWTVLVTDRSEDDLGVGVLGHLIGQQLRSPDPWQAVRQRFGATAVDVRLTSAPQQQAIAQGLLEVMPAEGWPAAPGGVLTRDHALGSVARTVLGLDVSPLDLIVVLGWTTRADATRRLADLRDLGGDALADAVIVWIAGAAGDVAPAVGWLLRDGRPGDLVPLGLVTGFLQAETVHRHQAEVAIARLSSQFGGREDSAVGQALRLIGPQTETVTATLLTDDRTRPDADRVIAAADSLVRAVGAEGLAERSELLRVGLQQRLRRLADALREPVDEAQEIELAWQAVTQHALARVDPHLPVFGGAVRLARWLQFVDEGHSEPPATLAALSRRHADTDGWVDAAVNDAAGGVDDPRLGAVLEGLLGQVRTVRDEHDTEFANALAGGTRDEDGAGAGYLEHDGSRTYLLERVLPDVVFPLARRELVLLLVLDGLSAGVATEVLTDLLDNPAAGWAERLLAGSSRRAAALAVLPSITEVSRTSLLSGQLVSGPQDRESRGYAELTRAHGFTGSPLFHKRDLETARLGHSLADSVRHAIDDPEVRLVSAVLNTIDDALDRSDPAGTHWSVDAVKHLRPLLDRAREAGRTVVITSDHGHVVERRLGRQRSYPGGSATRYRTPGGPVQADEVLIEGPRVLQTDHKAVLAVSERLRYGPLKAGYHGGAAPAEVVVPVLVMVPIERAQDPALQLAPSQQPEWWSSSVIAVHSAQTARPAQPLRELPVESPTLFDEEPSSPSDGSESDWATRLVRSTAYEAQKRLAGRLAIADDQVCQLLGRLLTSPQHRLGAQQCAVALGIAPARLTGAIEHARRLLNIDGYPVIVREPATGAVILDVDLAEEQFGVTL